MQDWISGIMKDLQDAKEDKKYFEMYAASKQDDQKVANSGTTISLTEPDEPLKAD